MCCMCMNTIQEKQTEVMGVQLSQTLKWDGFKIMEVSIAALTDANFHPEAKIISEMLEKLQSDPMMRDPN